MANTTCNSTLDDMRIAKTSEVAIAGSLTFHQLSIVIGGVCAAIAVVVSLALIFMHARNYTVPYQQKHTIRILLMVPIYSMSAFLGIQYYYYAIYYSVISGCYEAFAISAFFALMCSFIAESLHDQKVYFRDQMTTVRPWVMPINLLAKCWGGQSGPWRTPRNGLTWFNIIWVGIYHYCFIRVTMTITAVVTQYFGKYCESSNSPFFGHIWILVIESIAVSIAMYSVIQFYVQLKGVLRDNQPFLKVLAIKLVIFLSFWQSSVISFITSDLNFSGSEKLAYPDVKVVIPNLLLCAEMAGFAFLHIWAFPYQPYRPATNGKQKAGGVGKALWDAVNLWDVVKAVGRGMRWLFVGVKKRHAVAVSVKDAPDNSDSIKGTKLAEQSAGIEGIELAEQSTGIEGAEPAGQSAGITSGSRTGAGTAVETVEYVSLMTDQQLLGMAHSPYPPGHPNYLRNVHEPYQNAYHRQSPSTMPEGPPNASSRQPNRPPTGMGASGHPATAYSPLASMTSQPSYSSARQQPPSYQSYSSPNYSSSGGRGRGERGYTAYNNRAETLPYPTTPESQQEGFYPQSLHSGDRMMRNAEPSSTMAPPEMYSPFPPHNDPSHGRSSQDRRI